MASTPNSFNRLLARRDTKAILILLALLLVWLLLAGGDGESSATNNAKEDQTLYVPEVKVTPSEAQSFVQELTISAATESARMVEVTTQTSGIIDEINAKEGTHVFKGEAIATLKSDIRPAMLAKAQAQVKQRQLEYEASKKLSQSGYRSEVTLAEDYYQLKEAQANLKEAQLELEYSQIVSPFTGYLNRIYVDEGDRVKALETSIAQVMDIKPMLAVGYVPEKWRSYITHGSYAMVIMPDGKELEATIEFVSLKSEDATRTYRVEVAIINEETLVPAGMTVEMHIPLQQIKAHLIPSSALSLSDAGELQVKYVDEANKVLTSPIEIAGEAPEGVWVMGLPDQIDLISYGQAFVRDGDEVTVSKER